ncbi:unnamed protein product [Vicia faba]|uniref:Uncharacterized protein n=1 Tax=Vicia faba TaxID=3906 RepID=A0AAV1A1F1_VICFA|nr:unnamed protein product [Vicia faba]
MHGKGKEKEKKKIRGLRGHRSFLDVVNNTEALAVDSMVKESMKLSFDPDPESFFRLKKSYMEKVVNPSMAYNIQNCFEIEGYFQIKVTSIGDNLCLLEEVEDGVINDLINKGNS